jgi:hypothetical protein
MIESIATYSYRATSVVVLLGYPLLLLLAAAIWSAG